MFSADNSDRLYSHIEQNIGRITNVFKEVVTDELSIDILCVGPTPERNCYTLITSGMSELAMTVPPGAEDYQHAELMISLPATWKLSDADFQDERNYWPLGTLKGMARFPHHYTTWLYRGHTVANGNPPRLYADNAPFQSLLLWPPAVVDQTQFANLTLPNGKKLQFYNLLPLYKEELDFALKNGSDALIPKLDKAGISDVVNLSRKNSCKKVLGIF